MNWKHTLSVLLFFAYCHPGFSDTVEQLENELSKPTNLFNKEKRVDLIIQLAETSLELNPATSRNWVNKALELMPDTLTLSPKLFNLYITKGKSFLYQSRFDEARGYFQKMLEWTEKEGEKGQKVQSLWLLGEVYQRTYAFEEAQVLLKRAMELTETENDQRLLGKIHQSIAHNYNRHNHFEDAAHHFNEASNLLWYFGNDNEKVALRLDRGFFEHKRRNYIEAIELANEAYDILENIESNFLSIRYWILMGTVYSNLELNHEAMAFLEKIKKDVIDYGDSRLLAELHYAIGSLEIRFFNEKRRRNEKRNKKEVLEYFEKGVEIARGSEYKEMIVKLLWRCMRLLNTQSFGQTKLAEEYFEEGYKLAASLKDTSNMSFFMNEIGKVYAYDKDCLKAEKYVKEGLTLASSIKTPFPFEKIFSYQELAKVYDCLGDYKKKSWANGERSKLSIIIYRSEFDILIKKAHIEFETEKKDQENKTLMQEQALKEAELKNQRLWIGLLSILAVFFMGIAIYVNRLRKAKIIANQKLKTSYKKISHQKEEIENNNQVLEQLYEVLNQKNKDLKKANERKTDFIAQMSHELRTPLNSIMILSELISKNENENLSQEQIRQSAKVINNSGKDLLALINDIIFFSRIEKGILNIKPTEVNTEDISRHLLEQFTHQMKQSDLNYTVALNENMPAAIFVDKTRLIQLLRNLVNNSIKYTSKGGAVELSLFNASLENLMENLTVKNDEILLGIEVKDTGVGIPEDQLPHIFDAFYQSKNNPKKSSGLGLGLAIVNKLVKLMDGKVGVSSELGVGTVFKIFLPVKVVEQEIENPVLSQSHSGNVIQAKPYKQSGKQTGTILIVDDDEINLLSLKMAIEETSNYHVIQASSGKECLEILKRNLSIDLLFIDMMMPELDGYQTIGLIRKMPFFQNLPIVAATAKTMKGDKEKCLEAGATDYLSKPIELEKLSRLIHAYMPQFEKIS